MHPITPEPFFRILKTKLDAKSREFDRDWAFSDRLNALMLDTVLPEVATELKCNYLRERYTIDAALVSGRAYAHAEEQRHPLSLDALIEHEVGGYLYDEIWKLANWRSPLKVLITYDWDREGSSQGVTEQLYDHLMELASIVAKLDCKWPENPQTEYLFVVGRRSGNAGAGPEWIPFLRREALRRVE